VASPAVSRGGSPAPAAPPAARRDSAIVAAWPTPPAAALAAQPDAPGADGGVWYCVKCDTENHPAHGVAHRTTAAWSETWASACAAQCGNSGCRVARRMFGVDGARPQRDGGRPKRARSLECRRDGE